jgi:hypothetical protein
VAGSKRQRWYALAVTRLSEEKASSEMASPIRCGPSTGLPSIVPRAKALSLASRTALAPV